MSLVLGGKARKLLWKGASGYLAYIVNQPKDKAKVGQVPIVKDFPDVFPEELNSIPPEREVEFTIDLLPEAAPLSKTPYRMAPAELKELKDQLQELLNSSAVCEEEGRNLENVYKLPGFKPDDHQEQVSFTPH